MKAFTKLLIAFAIFAICSQTVFSQWSVKQKPQVASINSIVFRSSDVGYIATSGGVYKTTNAGSSWTLQTANKYFSAIYFVNDNLGFACGEQGNLIKTTNAGANWSDVNSGISFNLNSIYFKDVNSGIAVGNNGAVRYTTDGGSSWNPPLNVPTANLLRSVYMVSQNEAYAVGENSILKSVDGGRNWNITSITSGEDAFSVYFTDNNTGFVVGKGGLIYRTINAGASWTKASQYTTSTLYSIYFANTSVGYAVGENGAVILTTDGGTTWKAQNSGLAQVEQSVFMTSANTAFVAGYDGVSYTTSLGNGSDLSIHIIKPNGGESLSPLNDYDITWDNANITHGVYLQYTTDNGTSWKPIGTNPNSNKIQRWNVPNESTALAKIRAYHQYFPGVYDVSDNNFTIGNPAPSISVISPALGAYWQAGTTQAITWNPIFLSGTIKIDYTTNNGSTWLALTDNIPAANASYSWSVFNTPSSSCKIRLTSNATPAATAQSQLFTISAAPAPFISISNPTNASVWQMNSIQNVSWTGSNLSGTVAIDFSRTGVAPWERIKSGAPVTGTYSWTIPSVLSNSCKIRISSEVDPNISFTSDAFAIVQAPQPDITISSPTAFAQWQVGTEQNVSWTSVNYIGKVRVEYSTNNGSNYNTISVSDTANGSHKFIIPNVPSDNCLIKITAIEANPVYEKVSSKFSIVSAPAQYVVFANPLGGEAYQSGTTKEIRWNFANVNGTVKIEYSLDGGVTKASSPIATGVLVSQKSYMWILPSNINTTNARLYITLETNPSVNAMSNMFAIYTPAIAITYPTANSSLAIGSFKNISWTSSYVGKLDIKYSADGVKWDTIISNINSTPNSYTWNVPNVPSNNAKIRIYSKNLENDIYAESDDFAIIQPRFTNIIPGRGEILRINDIAKIKWNNENVDLVKIEYSVDAGKTYSVIISSFDAKIGEYSWSVNASISDSCLIRLTSEGYNPNVALISDKYFRILPALNPQITLTSPNGGEKWLPGRTKKITWNSSDIDSINIEVSYDNGVNKMKLGTFDATLGSTDWLVPNNPSANCRIYVTDVKHVFINDNSDQIFTILDPNDYSLKLLSPNGAEKWYVGDSKKFLWSASSKVDTLSLDYSIDGGVTWMVINDKFPSNSTYTWVVPRTPTYNALIRIKLKGIEDVFDVCDASFTIAGLDLTAPNENMTVLFDQKYAIKWTSADVQNVRIQYSYDWGLTWVTVEESYPGSTGLYNWTIPNTPSSKCLVRLIDNQHSKVFDISSSFTISGLILNNPNQNTVWLSGAQKDIEWSSAAVDRVKLEYTTNAGVKWTTIVSNTDGAVGKYNWNVPYEPSDSCKLRITDVAKPDIFSENAGLFKISGVGMVLTFPNLKTDTLQVDSTYRIKWTSVNIDSIDIYLSVDNGRTYTRIITGIDAGIGFAYWKVTDKYVATLCRIKIVDRKNGDIIDMSDEAFRIRGKDQLFPPPPGWDYTSFTGSEAVIVVPAKVSQYQKSGKRPLENGDYIGVFFERNGSLVCGGYGRWIGDSTNIAITVWGDNVNTPSKDGFSLNDTYIFKWWDSREGDERFATVSFEKLYDPLPEKYGPNKISILKSFITYTPLAIKLKANRWQLISSNLLANPDNIDSLMKDVASSIDVMKNDHDGVYIPLKSKYVNSINNWNLKDGYQIYPLQDTTLYIMGSQIYPRQYPLIYQPLKWYIIPYLSNYSMSLVNALQTLRYRNTILMMKNSDGKVYFPNYGINDIQNMSIGEGFKLCLTALDTLYYPYKLANDSIDVPAYIVKPYDNQYYALSAQNTGSSAVLVVESSDIANGDEVAATDEYGTVVGRGIFSNGKAALTVWGVNQSAPELGGIRTGEVIKLKYINYQTNKEYALDIKNLADMFSGKISANVPVYRQDAILIAQAVKGILLNVESDNTYQTIKLTPNPVSTYLNIEYSNPNGLDTQINIFNNLGNEVIKLVGSSKQGNSIDKVDVSNLPSGVYKISVKIGENVINSGFTVIK